MEAWKPVEGFPWYEISDHGQVRSIMTGKLRRFSKHKYGYLNVALRNQFTPDRSHHRYVHRLVAYAFVPNPDGLPDVHHKDNNPGNNHHSNLQWVTHKQNLAYAVAARGGVHWCCGRSHRTRSAAQLLAFDGERLIVFRDYKEAADKLGKQRTTFASVISKAIRNNWAAYGFTWRRTVPRST